MSALRILKIVAVVMGVIIIVLLGVLVFVSVSRAPSENPSSMTPSGSSANPEGSSSPATSADKTLTVTSPLPGATVSSPLTITGTVQGGGWFFEAIFPVKVFDGNGNLIGAGSAEAQPPEAWMSTGTVPFTATISFVVPHTTSGTVMLQNDNPSGLPEHQKQLVIPIRFQ